MAVTLSNRNSPARSKVDDHKQDQTKHKQKGKLTQEGKKQVVKKARESNFGPFAISPESLAEARAKTGLAQWFEVFKYSALGFMKDQCTQLAAAMTYYTVFSLFPLLLLAITLISFFVQSEQAQQAVIAEISSLMPSTSLDIGGLIKQVIQSRGIASGLAILTLLWSALGFFDAIDHSVNYVWGVTVSRSFIKGKLFALAMLVASFVVFGGSWALTAIVGYLENPATNKNIPLIGFMPIIVWDVIQFFIPFLLSFVMLLLLYKYVPMRNLTFGDVWPAALIMGFIWELTRQGIAFYMTRFANYQSAYGPIGAVMALIFWLYIVGIVLMFGTELTKMYAIIVKNVDVVPVEPDAVPPVDVHQTSVEDMSGVHGQPVKKRADSYKGAKRQLAQKTESNPEDEAIISKEQVRQNLSGSVLFGALLGLILAFTRRKQNENEKTA